MESVTRTKNRNVSAQADERLHTLRAGSTLRSIYECLSSSPLKNLPRTWLLVAPRNPRVLIDDMHNRMQAFSHVLGPTLGCRIGKGKTFIGASGFLFVMRTNFRQIEGRQFWYLEFNT
ncbi:hypothetical protein Mapa_003499 [Marchantia paleacea]|nr:hypothetical protein Mapa_003499 [Marchantia paleacea]